MAQITNRNKDLSENYDKIAKILFSYGAKRSGADYVQIINTESEPIVIDLRNRLIKVKEKK